MTKTAQDHENDHDEGDHEGDHHENDVPREDEHEGDHHENDLPNEDEHDEDDREDVANESEHDREGAASPWDEKMRLVVELWEIGNNARLREVLDELEKAPKEDEAVHRLVAEYRRRLKPDPVAVALWLVTLFVFCLITYLFVIR